MRISVCEFLRLETQRNWYYRNPGHWVSDGQVFEAFCSEENVYLLYKGKRKVKVLEYFEGLSSNEVRRMNRGKS